MALAPLATTADLVLRGFDVPDPDLNAKALDVASSAVRDAAGGVISAQTSTLELNALHETFLPLPGPITAVTSVTVAGAAVTNYENQLDGLHRHAGWGGGAIVVTFTHGLPEVPDDIVDLTCNLAKAWLDHVDAGGGSTAGLSSVRLVDAAESYTEESAGQVSPVYIPAVTRRWLAARFGGGAQVVSTR